MFAALTGFIWAHDRLYISAIAGCILIFLGMVIAEISVKKGGFKGKHKAEVEGQNVI